MSFLETRHLYKLYRRGQKEEIRALEDVCLAIPRGTFTALTGPSGSGKTTLLTLLGALDRPTRGQVLFDGQDLRTFSDVGLARCRRRMGFLFQDFALIPDLLVWEHITYPLIPRGVPRSERRRRAQLLLERFGLAERSTERPPNLSGGEQQRVALARALIGDPEILFADEPTSNLDAVSAQDLIAHLHTCHSGGQTIVVSTHDQRLVALATMVHALHGGRLVGSHPPEQG
jgi:putative ABC transport system ATP-binding protein